ncbi:MAG: hypothetical protein M1835_004355 [Candelina submexicana]|nr:MAG: hypothetical protein M1835_004355 [Candelina submexicana]
MAARTLFTLPIQPTGGITCTTPLPKVYLLTFNSPPDNRLRPSLIEALLLALDIIEYKHPKGVLITTSGIQKFYSNGLDYESAIKTPGFFPNSLYPLWRRVLTYPMPTISLLNGHAFAAGLMLALMHDYRFQNPHRGFLCLNELDFGAPLKAPMASIFRDKLPSPHTFRTLVLESKRFTALEALKDGIVDGLGGMDECLTFVDEMGLRKKGQSGVYGRLKEEMWRETVGFLDDYEEQERRLERLAVEQQRRAEEGRKNVAEWERRQGGKSKL